MCPLWSGSGEPCGGTTGAVEGDHALRLLPRGEGLEAPLTGTVGGLVGDGEHRSQGLKVEAGSLPLEISVAGEGAGLLPPVCQCSECLRCRPIHHRQHLLRRNPSLNLIPFGASWEVGAELPIRTEHSDLSIH